MINVWMGSLDLMVFVVRSFFLLGMVDFGSGFLILPVAKMSPATSKLQPLVCRVRLNLSMLLGPFYASSRECNISQNGEVNLVAEIICAEEAIHGTTLVQARYAQVTYNT